MDIDCALTKTIVQNVADSMKLFLAWYQLLKMTHCTRMHRDVFSAPLFGTMYIVVFVHVLLGLFSF